MMNVGMEGVGRAEARRLREQSTSHHLSNRGTSSYKESLLRDMVVPVKWQMVTHHKGVFVTHHTASKHSWEDAAFSVNMNMLSFIHLSSTCSALYGAR